MPSPRHRKFLLVLPASEGEAGGRIDDHISLSCHEWHCLSRLLEEFHCKLLLKVCQQGTVKWLWILIAARLWLWGAGHPLGCLWNTNRCYCIPTTTGCESHWATLNKFKFKGLSWGSSMVYDGSWQRASRTSLHFRACSLALLACGSQCWGSPAYAHP